MSATGPLDGDWRSLWQQYGPRLLLFARQQTPDLGAAEDLVQEAFVRYWKARQKEPGLPPSLLYTMLKRAAIDLARQTGARQAREAAADWLAPGEPALFECPFEDRERRELLEGALRALPVEQREVLVLKVWGDLTFAEIGQTLDLSPHTAASRYRYGLAQLKELLTPAQP